MCSERGSRAGSRFFPGLSSGREDAGLGLSQHPGDTSDSKAVSESRLKLCRDDSGRICLGFMYPGLLTVYPHTILRSLALAELHFLPFPQTQKP